MARSSGERGGERPPAHRRGRLTKPICLSVRLASRGQRDPIHKLWLGSGEAWLTAAMRRGSPSGQWRPWLGQRSDGVWQSCPPGQLQSTLRGGSEGQQGAERRSGMRPSHSNPASLPGAVVCVRRSRTLRTLCRYASLQLSLTFPCIFDTAISTTHHRHLSTG